MGGMDDLDLIKSRLADIPVSRLPELALATGVPKDTLIKVKYGTTKNPRYETVKALADYYRAQEARA